MDKDVLAILKKVEEAGFEAAIVGGAVRDLLTGKEAKDWDLTTNATPEEILKIFPNAFYNNKFGTVGVPSAKEKVVEITTYRSEKGYTDSRHPDEVVWGETLEEDLKRRDFTVNAMAAKPVGGNRKPGTKTIKIGNDEFEIVDLFGGQEDLKNKIIKAVGDANARFTEDALRMIRAVRFATSLVFEFDPKTKRAILENAELVSKISGERTRDEVFKIIQAEDSDRGFFLLRETGLLRYILPELEICFEVEQVSPKRHHIWDVGTHCVMSMKTCPSKNTFVKFAALLHDIGKAKVAKVTDEGIRTFYNHEVAGAKQAKEICDRFHLSRDDREKVYRLVRWHQFSVGEDQTDKAIRRFITNVGLENVEDMIDVRIGDRLGSGLTESESWRLKLFRKKIEEVLKKPFTVSDLKVSGNDVMEVLKIKPGPEVGKILNALFKEVLEDEKKNKREYLLGKIKRLK